MDEIMVYLVRRELVVLYTAVYNPRSRPEAYRRCYFQ